MKCFSINTSNKNDVSMLWTGQTRQLEIEVEDKKKTT